VARNPGTTTSFTASKKKIRHKTNGFAISKKDPYEAGVIHGSQNGSNWRKNLDRQEDQFPLFPFPSFLLYLTLFGASCVSSFYSNLFFYYHGLRLNLLGCPEAGIIVFFFFSLTLFAYTHDIGFPASNHLLVRILATKHCFFLACREMAKENWSLLVFESWLLVLIIKPNGRNHHTNCECSISVFTPHHSSHSWNIIL